MTKVSGGGCPREGGIVDEPMTTSGSDPPDGETLVRGLRAGEPWSLQRLLDAHWDGVVRYAEGILADTGDAQDAAQEAFVRLWERRETWSIEGSVRGLLYTMARNAALDELRRRDRRAAVATAVPAPEPTRPDRDAEGSELRRAAEGAVRRLPAQRREVFRLVREHGLSHREIADVLGLSPQTVANHMSLALADLRRALRPYLSDPPAASD